MGATLHRQHVGQRAGGDHDAAGMDAQMVGLTDKRVSRPHDLLLSRIVERRQHIVHRALVGRRESGCQ